MDKNHDLKDTFDTEMRQRQDSKPLSFCYTTRMKTGSIDTYNLIKIYYRYNPCFLERGCGMSEKDKQGKVFFGKRERFSDLLNACFCHY